MKHSNIRCNASEWTVQQKVRCFALKFRLKLELQLAQTLEQRASVQFGGCVVFLLPAFGKQPTGKFLIQGWRHFLMGMPLAVIVRPVLAL